MTAADLDARLRRIRLLVSDVDGVLTDGTLRMSAEGDEDRRYCQRDEDGLLLARKILGLRFALLSAGKSDGLLGLGNRLEAEAIQVGATNKEVAFAAMLQSLDTPAEATAYVGDDLVDIGPLRLAGLACTVCDADPAVLPHAQLVTSARGGTGVIYEICEQIIRAQRPEQLSDIESGKASWN